MKFHASDTKTDALGGNAATNRIQGSSGISLPRRRVLTAVAAGGALAFLGAPAVRAQDSTKIRIGYWPVSSGLPFYAAYDMGYFKDAGLNVEALKFASAQQVIEGMIAGRAEGSANGVASGVLAVGELAQPGLFKI
jgi:NitT/TauT family transport system substrate-binding protein